MNNEDKLAGARAIGSPVFFTAQELEWLSKTMLKIARESDKAYPTNQDKLDFLYSAAIGMKVIAVTLDNEDEDKSKEGKTDN